MSYFREALRRHTTARVTWTSAEQLAGPRIAARRAAQNMGLAELLAGEAHAMQAQGFEAEAQVPAGGDHQRAPYVLCFSPDRKVHKDLPAGQYPATLSIRIHPEPSAGFLCEIAFPDAAGQRVTLTLASIYLDNQTVHYWLHAFYDLTLTAQLQLAEIPDHLPAGAAAALA